MSYINLGQVRDAAELISIEHFGLNYVANYERIGAQPWETFDETVERLGAQDLRYPGGSFSESYFDLRNPNRTQYVADDGSIQQVEPLHDFLVYCESVQRTATVIIPTRVLLTDDNYGSRNFDESWSLDVYDFVYETLASSGGGSVSTFELGNEYESYMTSTEYGRVASRLAEITQDAIDDFRSDNNLSQNWTEPSIAIQTWSFNVQNSLTPEEQSLRNQAVMDEFPPEQIQAVDAIVSHYYYDNNRYLGYEQEQSYENMENAVQGSIELLQDWGQRFGRNFDIRYSEWNTFHLSDELLGLAQLPAIIGLFDAMTGNGVDSMHFWSAQYHASSAALNNGTLTAAGTLFDFMRTELIGFQSINISSDVQGVEFAGFSQDDELIIFASSISDEITSLTLDDGVSFRGYEVVLAQTIIVDESFADGVYRNLDGLPFYLEPDLPAYIANFSLPDGWNYGLQTLSLSPYQTIILKLEEFGTTFDLATNGDDVFVATPDVRKYYGADGFDTVQFADALSGQSADLINDTAPDGTKKFEDIEGLVGSAHDDTLRGNGANNILDGMAGDDNLDGRSGDDYLKGGSGSDEIFGGSGNDILDGGSGDDTIFGQDGNDTIMAENGDDRIYAGEGDDLIIYSAGIDRIDGGEGEDTLDFASVLDGVSVWGNSYIAEVPDGEITFEGIENFILGAGDDRLDVHFGGGVFADMGAGVDFVTANGNNNHIILGEGDDLIYNDGESNRFVGGAGDDRFFSYAGSMLVSGGLGEDFYYLNEGSDTLVFFEGDGNDRVANFDLSLDSLLIDLELLELIESGEHSIFSVADGTTLDFGGNSGSITFLNLDISDVTQILEDTNSFQGIDLFQ